MKTYILIINMCIVLIITSCSSYRFIDIQILNPGVVKFPFKNSKLIIIDPSKTGCIPKDSINHPYSLLTINNFNAILKKQLENSPLFQDSSVKIIQTPISIRQTCFSKHITKKNYLDSLKKLYSNEKDNVILLSYGFHITGALLNPFYRIEVLNSKFQFELSNLKTREVYNWYQIADKQSWCKMDQKDTGSMVIIKACKNIAESYAHRLAPYWTTEERIIIYSPNRMMRKADMYFCDNDLDKAVEIWKQLFDIGTRRLSSQAAYNIALVYEMQDDLNSCENWLVKSTIKKVNPTSREYLDNIRNRKLACTSLDIQL